MRYVCSLLGSKGNTFQTDEAEVQDAGPAIGRKAYLLSLLDSAMREAA
jgi:hypothetical protein